VQASNDGDSTTVWLAGSPTANLTVDLGSPTSVSQVQVDSGTSSTVAYTIQGSTDDSTWTTLASEPAGTGQDTTVSFTPATERYLRFQETAPANGPITNGVGGGQCLDDDGAYAATARW
jgi:F5/8 type C domain